MLKKGKLLTATFISALLITVWVIVTRLASSLALVTDPGYGVAVPAGNVEWMEFPREVELASHWSNRHQRHADFKIAEDAFLRMFADKTFKEVSPLDYSILEEVDNPSEPKFSERSADSGLVYSEEWNNGGGIRITFDRSAGIASYDYVGW